MLDNLQPKFVVTYKHVAPESSTQFSLEILPLLAAKYSPSISYNQVMLSELHKLHALNSLP